MKNNFKALTLSLFLTLSVGHSSNFFEEPAPKMVANQMGGISKTDQGAETELLKQGCIALQAQQLNGALTFFQAAIENFGSPLGYLYASALEEDKGIGDRYFIIVERAVEYEAFSKEIFNAHLTWLTHFFDRWNEVDDSTLGA